MKNNPITIIGAGNMAWHLGHAFIKAGARVDKIFNRSRASAIELAVGLNATYSNNINELKDFKGLIVVAVNDSGISDILNTLNAPESIIVHTSGSVGIDVFQNNTQNGGVLYPFQSLTKNVGVNFSEIPVCIEAQCKETLDTIRSLALLISKKVVEMDTEKRRKLHLAGVVANNFTNHLLARTFDFLEKNNIDNQLLVPIIAETLNKLKTVPAREAQTGPARRSDLQTIRSHLNILSEEHALKKLYSLISDSIIAYYS